MDQSLGLGGGQGLEQRGVKICVFVYARVFVCVCMFVYVCVYSSGVQVTDLGGVNFHCLK